MDEIFSVHKISPFSSEIIKKEPPVPGTTIFLSTRIGLEAVYIEFESLPKKVLQTIFPLTALNANKLPSKSLTNKKSSVTVIPPLKGKGDLSDHNRLSLLALYATNSSEPL